MDRFEAMRTLVAAVDGGSLSAASRGLGVPLPTVSRRISDLEAHLRAQLVIRTSRKLLVTEAGRASLATCRRVLEELDEAERVAAGEFREPRGELLVAAPVMFGRMHVEPVVLDFLDRFREIGVRLTLSDAFVDLVESRIDAAVRIGPLPDSTLVGTRLGAVGWVTCASPAYLAARGEPKGLADLAGHDCIAFDRMHGRDEWTFADGGREVTIGLRPRLAVNSAAAVIDAAIAGAGIGRVLSYQAAPAIAAGQLTVVLGEYRPAPLPVHLVHSGQAILPQKVRAFRAFAAPRLKTRLTTAAV